MVRTPRSTRYVGPTEGLLATILTQCGLSGAWEAKFVTATKCGHKRFRCYPGDPGVQVFVKCAGDDSGFKLALKPPPDAPPREEIIKRLLAYVEPLIKREPRHEPVVEPVQAAPPQPQRFDWSSYKEDIAVLDVLEGMLARAVDDILSRRAATDVIMARTSCTNRQVAPLYRRLRANGWLEDVDRDRYRITPLGRSMIAAAGGPPVDTAEQKAARAAQLAPAVPGQTLPLRAEPQPVPKTLDGMPARPQFAVAHAHADTAEALGTRAAAALKRLEARWVQLMRQQVRREQLSRERAELLEQIERIYVHVAEIDTELRSIAPDKDEVARVEQELNHSRTTLAALGGTS
jgi:hypothetical protein